MTQLNSPAHSKRPYRSKEQWHQLIDAFEASDLSVDDYCAQHDLKLTTFYKWRNRLQQEARAQKTSPSFIELTDFNNTPLQPANQSAWDIELELGSGAFLRIRRS